MSFGFIFFVDSDILIGEMKKSKVLGTLLVSFQILYENKNNRKELLSYEYNSTAAMEPQGIIGEIIPAEEEKWNVKKRKNILYTNALIRIKQKKKDKFPLSNKAILRVRDCSRILTYNLFADNTRRLKKAMMCRNRYCPVCTWRRSIRLGIDNKDILDCYLGGGGRLIFVTFTVPNCRYNKLRETLNILNYSLNKFRGRKSIKRISYGDIKTLEVTVDKKNRTFHPHIHCLFAVSSNYFDKNNPDYIKHEQMQRIWQDCVGSRDYLYLNVQAVRDSIGAAREISKYVAKDDDYIRYGYGDVYNDDDEVLYYLYRETKNLRFVSYTGVFSDIRKSLKIKDIEAQNESELLGVGKENESEIIGIEKYRWDYGFSSYLLSYVNLDGDKET